MDQEAGQRLHHPSSPPIAKPSMENIHTAADLKSAILRLEKEQEEQGKMLKEQFNQAYESIKPINLIKSTFREAAASRDLKENLLNLTVSVVTGHLSQVLIVRGSNNPFKKLLGTVVMFGMSNALANNPQIIGSAIRGIGKLVSSKSEPSEVPASIRANGRPDRLKSI